MKKYYLLSFLLLFWVTPSFSQVCPEVTGHTLSAVTTEEVTMVWNADTNDTWEYTIYSAELGFDNATIIPTTDTFIVEQTGIETNYEGRVRTVCGLNVSGWSTITWGIGPNFPPGNDLIINAEQITINGDTVSVTNIGASMDGDSVSCWDSYTNGDVWLTFEVSVGNAPLEIELSTFAGSSNNSHIALYSGSGCGSELALTELACDEDSGLENMAYIAPISLDAGTYYIQCATLTNAEGSYQVIVTSDVEIVPSTINFEGFEGADFLPNCWTSIDADGDGYNWIQSNDNPFEGVFTATSMGHDIEPDIIPDDYLISPLISLGDCEVLSFQIATGSMGWVGSEEYGVFISTTGNAEIDFTDELIN